MRGRRRFRFLSAFLALGVITAACGGDDGESSPTSTTRNAATATAGTANAPATTKAPVSGGVITVGQFSREGGLDPAKLAGGGTVGGTEAAALYDVLMYYNAPDGTYKGGTAESLTPSADLNEWTMKLRPNIKFNDGTPYDAEAVKWVLERQMKDGNAAPRSQLQANIETITVVDPLTLKFKARRQWTGFPYLFVGVNGLMYSKATFERLGAEKFNLNPENGGAGPFKIKSYKPGESIEMEKNPNYWGGQVYLDGIKFVLVRGAQPTVDALKTGTLQAGFVRDPRAYDDAKKAGMATLDMQIPSADIITMNSGVEVTCTGASLTAVPACAGQADGTKVTIKSPTQDVRVRRAVMFAVDPKVVNDRAHGGKAIADAAPFVFSPWDPKVTAPKPDLNEAKKLVTEAKAAGWDGKIRLAAGNDSQTNLDWADAVAAQLEAAGMTVEKQVSGDTNDVVSRVLTRRDYDLAKWAYGLADENDNNFNQLFGIVNNKTYGYGTPEAVAAVDQLRTADTDAKRVAAYKAITEVWFKDVPALSIVHYNQAMISTPKLNGMIRTGASIVLFHKAFLEK